MTTDQTHVIVGASLAGAKAAETLRAEGFDGRLVLIGAEDERPYERPPLSKEYLRGEAGREKVYVHDEGFYAEHDIELRLGRTAVEPGHASARADARRRRAAALRPAAARHRRGAATAPDSRCRARRGALPAQRAGLRRPARAAGPRRRGGRRRRRLDRRRGGRLRAPARPRGHRGRPASVPLERVLGAEVGAVYRDIHADHGVRMLLGTGVEAFEGDASGRAGPHQRRARASTATSSSSASASSRATELAARGRASRSTTGSWSTSSCGPARRACSPPATWRTPTTPSTASASASSTGPTRCTRARRRPATCSGSRPYERLPYFFSDQYDVGMEYSGFARKWDRVVFRGDPGEPRVHRLLDGGGPGGRRHERQRLGRHRADPGGSSASAPPSTTGASPTPTSRSTSSHPTGRERSSEPPPGTS